MRHDSLTIAAAALFVLMIAVTAAQALSRPFIAPAPTPKPNTPCVGQPIVVDYPYAGGFVAPHACKVQCQDNVARYILYTNGKATQCETPPGCTDWGEDKGVECVLLSR